MVSPSIRERRRHEQWLLLFLRTFTETSVLVKGVGLQPRQKKREQQLVSGSLGPEQL